MSKPLTIFEPAAALAAARCLAARVRDPDRWLTSDHPSRCGWCDYPTVVLDGMVTGFNEWAGWHERNHTVSEFELRVFRALPRDEQRAAISAAQCLEPGDPPTHGPTEGEGASNPSGSTVGVGPHGSRLPGDSGSRISADEPEQPEQDVAWLP